jgi:hypothetical protein
VRLRAFHAADGDCLLLSSSDGHHALVDGGRSRTFEEEAWPELRAMADAGERLDLLVVSHIDADHITGVLRLMRAVAAWAVHDHQVTDGGNPDARPPGVGRPPAIGAVWHNSWRAQVGDLAGDIEAALAALAPPGEGALGALAALDGLAQSIPEGVELLRMIDEDTPLARNEAFGGGPALLRAPPHVEPLGRARLTVLGPSRRHLERLREEWRRWLADLGAAAGGADGPGAGLAEAARVIASTDPSKVTPPNRASITLLAEEDGRTCLLTGDAAEEELLDGLAAAGRRDGGPFHCDVLKVQHHGSEHNLSTGFAEAVVADHYVFSADGAHGNPEPSVIRTVVEARAAVPGPFTLWFTSSPRRTSAGRRRALEAALAEAAACADEHAAVSVRVLDDDRPFLEITL